MRGNSEVSTSGEQDAPETPAGSISPDQEKIAPQENTDEDLHLRCKEDPRHPGDLRCRLVSHPVVQKAASSLTTPPVDTHPRKSDAGGSKTPDSEGVEVWSRNNVETMRVKRIERGGRVLFEPIETTPKSQSADPQSSPLKTAKQDPSVGRTQLSRCGEGSKGSCTLPRTRLSTRVRQNDQTREEGI